MRPPSLLDDLIRLSAARAPAREALVDGAQRWSYALLDQQVDAFAASLMALGLPRGARVALYLENRSAFVVGAFGAARSGLVFVPINAVLKPAQVLQILEDSGARVLLTSSARAATLVLPASVTLWLVDAPLVDPHVDGASAADGSNAADAADVSDCGGPAACWPALMAAAPRPGHRVLDTDMAAILYTSGSTGRPKGVVLSHRNLVLGAVSVASYLQNVETDRLLAVLPLSFDAGFSQLTTAFHVGACVVLHNYLLPRDVLAVLGREHITGLTAVPPLYIQLAALDWPATSVAALRYFANTGGRMPRATLERLRSQAPGALPFLMYGLTEAFRSTYLPPQEVDRRPDSIGHAIPNVEILVLREDGTPCDTDEPGELVHRGPLVGQGYWRDPARTAERYRLLPGREAELPLPEYAVFSGDTVRRDAEGFLYFIGRRDEMIKTSGYRVSPTEVEEVVYATGLVGECVAFGIEHAVLGQSIHVLATAPQMGAPLDREALLAACRQRLPAYMVPAQIEEHAGALPRNPNGKIDRKLLSSTRQG